MTQSPLLAPLPSEPQLWHAPPLPAQAQTALGAPLLRPAPALPLRSEAEPQASASGAATEALAELARPQPLSSERSQPAPQTPWQAAAASPLSPAAASPPSPAVPPPHSEPPPEPLPAPWVPPASQHAQPPQPGPPPQEAPPPASHLSLQTSPPKTSPQQASQTSFMTPPHAPSLPPVTAQLPPPLAELQTRAEQLYFARLTQEAELMFWRARQPLVISWRRPVWALRALARLVPRFELWLAEQQLPRSGLFDSAWYLSRYPDVHRRPARHYLRHGGFERRDPSPWFSSGHYLDLYPDIVKARCNPLLHYLNAGRSEGRSIRPGMAEQPPTPQRQNAQ